MSLGNSGLGEGRDDGVGDASGSGDALAVGESTGSAEYSQVPSLLKRTVRPSFVVAV